MVDKIIGPWKGPCPHFQKLSLLADVAKETLQIKLRILRWGNFTALSGWAQSVQLQWCMRERRDRRSKSEKEI